MVPSLFAGLAAGLVLGFLGAGGAIVGIPILLFSASLGPHTVLGTNALGVAVIAGGLFLWRWKSGEAPLVAALTFAVPGLAGIWLGAGLGLLEPGQRLVFLLGFVLLAVAGWMLYLSFRSDAVSPPMQSRASRRAHVTLALLAVLVGAVSGFFAVGGGFMIVPALMIAGGLELGEAAAAALLPIATFTALVGIRYMGAGYVDYSASALMLAGGAAGGIGGVLLVRRLPKRVIQQCFAAALAAMAVYFFVR